MCGINGIFNYSENQMPGNADLIRIMNAEVRHRGPDDSGFWCDKVRGVFLGHQRLSILDLSRNGRQPMEGPLGNVITYNGEIFNFQQLRKKLGGHQFRSDTDTEVILCLYGRERENCLHRLDGMFAFAIWDVDRRELFLARDRIGIKPLYYTTMNGVFAFSSEIKALLTLPWVRAELDEEALYDFMTFNRVAPPLTMFKGIRKFHPGHLMTVGVSGITNYEPYWDLEYKNYSSLSESDIARVLASKLERAVGDWMVSDVPIGAFLSGGVDSSAVVAMMRRVAPAARIRTYSVGFKDSPAYNELEHARKVSTLLKTEHYEKVVSPEEIAEFLPKIVDVYDEPLADATSIPLFFISQAARESGTSVVMTGDGGDELFCGYRSWLRYVRMYPLYRLALKIPFRVNLFSIIQSFFPESSAISEIFNRAILGQEFFWGGAGGFKESAKRGFLSEAYASRMEGMNSHDHLLEFRRLYARIPKAGRKENDLDWMCFLGVKDILPNYYLYRADRMGMAHSVEVRVPLLDHRFVNFALSIPGELKVKGGEPKFVFKRALEPFLPRQILYRRKQGFCVPLREWATEIMTDYIDANLARFCRETGLFDESRLKTEVASIRYGGRDGVFMLWNVFFLISWFRKWLL